MSETLANKEIIDATQDAVLNAASSVANVIETTAEEINSAGSEAFYLEAEFWVGFAFVVAVCALAKPVGSVLLKMLRNKAVMIADRINEAVNLKEDAQKLLAEYKRKFDGVEKEVAEILLRSEKEIDLIKKDTIAKLEHEMSIKEKEAKARIKASEESASKEIMAQTSNLTIKAVKNILDERLDDKALSLMIDNSITNLENIK